ncbi:MAG: tRNA 2-thiouridine(34) synthase MnmA [Candidatus Yanofskybacteria bacterium]|nr:tRNA 2-thiouridine(34) synthase MnmA [Candidatus Yanofskybacteria bacterium]
MKRQVKKQKIYVAMSGGVDSSVAAALLKKQGYDVTGVFMKPWSPPVDKRLAKSFIHRCLWKQDREDAMRVAAKIGIPLLTWDFSQEYKKEVADYMIREYKTGQTPNPDVMCNKHIKFGLFLEKALEEGADYIATGHYIRKLKNKNEKLKINDYKLLKAVDQNKDQSYFLWTLTQRQLKHCFFPIGDYTKPEVRRMAKKFGLSTADKKDSQGVCFIGPLNMKEFLKNYIKPKIGNIILLDVAHSTRFARSGRVVGQHDGVFYYTIGQRHGLDIKNGKGPYFVVRKDIKNNIIYVGSKKDLLSQNFKLTAINWINPIAQPVDKRLRKSFIHRGEELDARTRYRAPLSKAVVKNSGEIVFKKPESAVTPGQSAVFYKGQQLLGGGIIL